MTDTIKGLQAQVADQADAIGRLTERLQREKREAPVVAALALLPEASTGVDNDGQIIIYTGIWQT